MKKVLSTILVLTLIISMGISQLVSAAPKELSDVKGNWAETDIQKLFAKGVIAGNEKGFYEPAKSISRSEFTTLLVKAMGLKLVDGNSFTDLNYNKYWARPYIETAVANNIIIVHEIGAEYFGDVPLKRSEMGIMMTRALKLNPSTNQSNPFFDLTEPNGYITKLYEDYLLRGITENGKLLFKGNSLSTKAECATVISRILDYKANPATFIAVAVAEEHIKNGTQTAADVEVKRAVEIQKQSQSSTYIIEPILTVEHNTDPYYPEYFSIYFENKRDYSDECEYKFECINYPQLNTIEMPSPIGTYKKYDLNSWRPLGSEYDNLRRSMYTLKGNYYATQEDIKVLKIIPGMKLDFRFTIIRGNETKIVNKTVIISDIQFKN